MPRKKVTVYTVRELHWEYNDEYFYRPEPDEVGDDGTLPYSEPLKAFLSREKAEAHRSQLERQRRRLENPFHYGDYYDGISGQSTHSEQTFLERLEELGLGGVDVGDDLNEWWDDNKARMTPAQREGVWDLCDLVSFYEVVPAQVPLEE